MEDFVVTVYILSKHKYFWKTLEYLFFIVNTRAYLQSIHIYV